MQQLLVATIVGIAIVASVWKLMPAKRRLRVLLALDAWAARRPALSGWRERKLKPRISRAAGAGCAGCAANVGVRPNHPPR
ncbi:MAG TPA: DUF6587 family protein [Burkholderiales bacterium]|jgi:hypothetical protein|nr:DUF6587 family protein [Burkholderiales bacterium]